MNEQNNLSVAVVTLWAEDPIRTAHFYKDVLGLQPGPHDRGHGGTIHFMVGEVYLVIRRGKPAVTDPDDRFPLVAFRTAAVDPVVARIKNHEIDLPWGIEEDAVSRWVMCYDPAGNLIEVAEFAETPLAGGG